jgi:hypothetical protein
MINVSFQISLDVNTLTISNAEVIPKTTPEPISKLMCSTKMFVIKIVTTDVRTAP